MLPSKSIQSSIRLMNSHWMTTILTDLEETGCEPQIAEGPDGNAIAMWKHAHTNNIEKHFAEFSMPGVLLNNNSSLIDRFNENCSGPTLQIIPSDLIQLQTTSSSSSHSLPAALPFPPRDIKGYQIADVFPNQTDFINIITWKKPIAGLTPVVYKIYRNQALTELAAIIPANRKLVFKDHNRKPHSVYTYFVIAVDEFGLQSPPVGIVFKGTHTHLITPILPVSITISPINFSIVVGSTQQFFATVTFSDGSTQILTDVVWNSSNPLVAKISADGLATGISSGSTIIRAILGNISIATTLNIVCSTPIIGTNFLPNGTVGDAYSQVIQVSTSPVTFSIVSGNLPNGLSLNVNTGIISGTPTTAQTASFTIQATSSCGNSATQLLSITINCPAITITTTTLPSGDAGTPYSAQIIANGLTPITFSVINGNLPNGLSLDSNTGVVSGIPTTAQTASFTIQATSSCGNSAIQPLSIIINCIATTINTTTLPDGIVNTSYSAQIIANGLAPITFSVINGNLPNGLSLDPNTGVVSGIPTTAQTASFTIQATSSCGNSATQLLSITINCPAITITTTTLPNAVPGVFYSRTIQTSGGIAPLTFSIDSGTLPAGLSLNSSTGVVSGFSPSAADGSPFTVRVISSCGSSTIQPFSISVVCTAGTLSPTLLPPGNVGAFYSVNMSVIGGPRPLNFVLDGSLPPGLMFSSGGRISGTPTIVGGFSFFISAIPAPETGCSGVLDSRIYNITISCAPIINTNSLPAATVNIEYSRMISITGGSGPFTFSIGTGALPPGLTLNPSTGVIAGVPQGPIGTYNFQIRVAGSCGDISARTLFITVN